MSKHWTRSELERARKQYGVRRACTNCGVRGAISTIFGWRRMHPGDRDIRPQPQCKTCRGRYRDSAQSGYLFNVHNA